MLIRFDPFRESDRIAQQLARSGDRTMAMPMDATRRGDRFFANFDLPGVDSGSIDLTVENNVLTVRAERTWQPEPDDQVIIAERPQGVFTRQLLLGENLDSEHVEATYRDGVLSLVIPIAEQAKPHKIPIGTSTGNGQRESVTSSA
jgi:HSP20 family protein